MLITLRQIIFIILASLIVSPVSAAKLKWPTSLNFLRIKSSTGARAPLIIEPGLLTPSSEDGAIEFDGNDLYITKSGVKTVLGGRGAKGEKGDKGDPGERGPRGYAGVSGPPGANGSFSGGDATVTGTLTFTGAGTTSDFKVSDMMTLNPQTNPPASPTTGQIYQDSSPALCVYMNGAWTKLAGTGTCASGTDSTPAAFDFTDTTGVPSTVTYSNTITTSAYDNASISISGTGSPEYSIDSGAYTSSAGTIYAGSTVRLRLTSHPTADLTRSATLTIGTVSDSWTVTSQACPTGFAYIPNSAGYDSFGNVNATYAAGWCVAQYEMSPQNTSLWTRDGSLGWHYSNSSGGGKKVTSKGGTNSFPITQITRNEAAAACASDLTKADGTVLTSGKLVTVYWWSKIGQAIVDDNINWSGNSPGSGNLSRGNANSGGPLEGVADATAATNPTTGTYYYTGTQGRAWRMGSTEGTVYDWAGNVWEWFDDLHNNASGAAWADINSSTTAFVHDNPNGAADITVLPSERSTHDNTTNGVGRINTNSTTLISGSTNAAFFGGSWWGDTTNAGVFSSYWYSSSPSATRLTHLGFRCMIPAQ